MVRRESKETKTQMKCVGRCLLNKSAQTCEGCGRTMQQIKDNYARSKKNSSN